MPEMSLNAGDAAELAETLQVLSDWLARDARHPGAPLARQAAHGCGWDLVVHGAQRLASLPAARPVGD